MIIEDKKVVSFHYELTNQEGAQLESSRDKEPMTYLHGANNIIPGLEKAMAGKSAGDKFQVTVEPAEAYGERKEANIQRISAKHFKNLRNAGAGPGCWFTDQARAGAGYRGQGRPVQCRR